MIADSSSAVGVLSSVHLSSSALQKLLCPWESGNDALLGGEIEYTVGNLLNGVCRSNNSSLVAVLHTGAAGAVQGTSPVRAKFELVGPPEGLAGAQRRCMSCKVGHSCKDCPHEQFESAQAVIPLMRCCHDVAWHHHVSKAASTTLQPCFAPATSACCSICTTVCKKCF